MNRPPPIRGELLQLTPRKRRWKNPLTTELVYVLLIKTGFILLIWWAFFSSPVDDNLDEQAVGKQLLGLSIQQNISAKKGETG